MPASPRIRWSWAELLPRMRRIAALIDTDQIGTGCWIWRGCLSHHGYGRTWAGTQARPKVHVLLYEMLHGPLPHNLELDHLCFTRNCVNPDHLELVTHRENLRRSRQPRGPRGQFTSLDALRQDLRITRHF